MGGLEMLLAGMLGSCALIYTSPAALPEQSVRNSSFNAFLTSLTLSCAFLLTDAVFVLSDALWHSTKISLMLCALFAFIFSKAAQWAIIPNMPSLFLPACTAVLVLVQPQSSDAVGYIMYALGTALGVIIIITALSPAIRRISLSDAPRCVKGLPAALLILGLGALAFGGF